jgi:hypothetical protein
MGAGVDAPGSSSASSHAAAPKGCRRFLISTQPITVFASGRPFQAASIRGLLIAARSTHRILGV